MNLFIVTGSSSGIGRALCENLLTDTDNRVIGLARRDGLQHEHYTHHHLDLSKLSLVEGFDFEIEPSQYKRITLVNNAGYLGDIKPVGKSMSSALTAAVNINLTAPILLSNHFLQTLKDYNGEKVIINISSGAANSSIDGWATYSATKAAIDRFTLTLQHEAQVHSDNLHAFSIAPGVVDTEMQGAIRSSNKDDFSMIERFKSLHQNNELTAPEEVAAKLIYIASHASDMDEVVFSLRNFDLP